MQAWNSRPFSAFLFETDRELKAVLFNICLITDKRIHMGMDYRIRKELTARNHAPYFHENDVLDSIIERDRKSHELDYQAYKLSKGI